MFRKKTYPYSVFRIKNKMGCFVFRKPIISLNYITFRLVVYHTAQVNSDRDSDHKTTIVDSNGSRTACRTKS